MNENGKMIKEMEREFTIGIMEIEKWAIIPMVKKSGNTFYLRLMEKLK